jgi:hypothetical protein
MRNGIDMIYILIMYQHLENSLLRMQTYMIQSYIEIVMKDISSLQKKHINYVFEKNMEQSIMMQLISKSNMRI